MNRGRRRICGTMTRRMSLAVTAATGIALTSGLLAQPPAAFQVHAPTTGFPAIQVPMGYTRGGVLPAGITFYGRAWSEATLIKLAYSYEQATRHRHAPVSTPPLR